MERTYDSSEQALAVAKEVIWLAWNACGGPSGYGFLRDKPGADKEAVWEATIGRTDYDGFRARDNHVDADYVLGRMMKLYFRIEGNKLTGISDYPPRGDYQAWCYRYKTYADLFDAAEAAIRTEPASEAAA